MPSLPRILVLVLSIDREPWRTIEVEGQRATWAAPGAVPAGCRVVFYSGRSGPIAQAARVAARLNRHGLAVRSARAGAELRGDRLHTRVPEAYRYTLPKLLAALRSAASGALGEFDYVYRANTSTYLVLDRLQREAAALPRERCYAGYLGKPPASGPPFVKGSGILLSRDLVTRVAETTDPWPWGDVDDAALGRAMAAWGIAPIPMGRVLVWHPGDVAGLSDEVLRTGVQFRCKSHEGTRNDDVTMRALHARLGAVVSTGA